MVQEYKCPCCGGGIVFDADSQKMKCPYCDTEFEAETLLEYDSSINSEKDDELNWEKSEKTWDEADGAKIFLCKSCGGELVGDGNTAATSCPYCGNPVVMTERVSDDLKPDCIIPFKLDKAAAIAALKKHYEGKKLLPKVFKDENHIKEVRGIYVPIWLFDADADADMRYRATRVRCWSDSRYDYTKTSYYMLTRGGEIGFERIPVDGSSKLDNTLMESIEPYDFSEAVDFNTAFLAGFFADKYDVSSDDCKSRANDRLKKSTEDAFARTVGMYTTVVPEHSSVRLKKGTTRYAMYPVWILNTEWEGETYTFAMNGQTGKFVGNMPMDKNAYARWFFGIAGAVSAVSLALSYLIWLL